eukprot:TRINITY_DN660_c0_g3_i2.p1 TRINITY_DN660_c0_g3~~TRINITY_DN660_c0_g3_i2.p1  ORF type:complete len:238 (-),score=45.30 TRINITY_DN660_c0_g3_i2:674-1387(-)
MANPNVVFDLNASKDAHNMPFFPTNYTINPSLPTQANSPQQVTPFASSFGQFISQAKNTSYNTGSFEDEPPLLEELGINFSHIKMKSMSVLNPLNKMDSHIMDDTDLAGPLFFCLLLGCFLLLSGKVHFGYIYGLGAVGCASMYGVLNLMSERDVDVYRVISVLGYCLLPMVLLAFISLLFPLNGIFGYICAGLTIAWCTHCASLMFVTVLSLVEQRLLVAYPTGLLYTCFALLTIF